MRREGTSSEGHGRLVGAAVGLVRRSGGVGDVYSARVAGSVVCTPLYCANKAHFSNETFILCFHLFPLLHKPGYNTTCVGRPNLLGQPLSDGEQS